MKKGTLILSTDVLESYDDEDDRKLVAKVPKNTVGVVLGPTKKVNVSRNGSRLNSDDDSTSSYLAVEFTLFNGTKIVFDVDPEYEIVPLTVHSLKTVEPSRVRAKTTAKTSKKSVSQVSPCFTQTPATELSQHDFISWATSHIMFGLGDGQPLRTLVWTVVTQAGQNKNLRPSHDRK